MQKKSKAYLIFSIVFWALIGMGLVLFGLSFGRVHINKYGILRNHYSSWISGNVYISGLYYVGITNYFIEIPSSKVYLTNLKLNVTNADLNIMQLTYTLVYRVNYAQVLNLYKSLSTSYEKKIVSTINSIISKRFANLTQDQSNVNVQSDLVTQIKNKFNNKEKDVLLKAIILEAFWLNGINYLSQQSKYSIDYLDTGTSSQAFEQMQLDMLNTNLQIQTLTNLINTIQKQISYYSNSVLQSKILPVNKDQGKQKSIISSTYHVGQIFQYYTFPRVSFE